METQSNAPAAGVSSDYLDGLASAFVAANKRYYFGDLADTVILRERLMSLSDCLEQFSMITVTGKITALNRLVSCYVQYSTDKPEERAQTLNAVTGVSGISELLEHLAANSETLDIWANFFNSLQK